MELKQQANTGAFEKVNYELTTLYELCAAVIQNIDVAEFLQTLIERAGRILQVRSGAIIMPDADGYLRIKAFFGLKEENARSYKVKPEEGRAGRIFGGRKGRIFITSEETESFHRITVQENIEHSIGAPMIDSSQSVMGVLFLNDKHTDEPFTQHELQILENFANLAAIAVEKQMQLEELNRRTDQYRELSERLEASLEELAGVNERLRESNKLKDEVLSICAHDVRSPLTSITSYAQLLGASGALDEKQRRYAEQIERSGEKINALVQNLLIRARYLESSAPIYLESISVRDLLQAAIEQVEDRLAGKGVRASIIERRKGAIRADRFKLGQVFDNLLDNAAKFTPEGGEIKIEITDDPISSDCMRVIVTNTGDGIPKEALPHLFSRYFRAPSVDSSGREKGYGLGLAICKQNVEMHGGSIAVESIPLERASFHIVLPVGQPYLLVVTANLALFDRICERFFGNWRCELAENDEACLKSLITELPTAVFIDGFNDPSKLLAELRRDYNSSRLRIASSGRSIPEEFEAVYLGERYEIEDILSAIE